MVMSVGWAVGEGRYGEIFDVVGGGRVLAVVLFVFFSKKNMTARHAVRVYIGRYRMQGRCGL